jgi:hypothetical protein
MTILLALIFSLSARAQEKCVAWPSVTAHGVPRLAATGMPFTNFLRFDCALGDRYFASGVEGEYSLGENKIAPASSLTTFTLSSGEVLYQALFSVSNREVAGVYVFDGCVRLRERQSGASVCLKLPGRSVEIVRTN